MGNNIFLKFNIFFKRIFDIVFSSLILLILSPILLLISLVIKLTSKGKVFFTQERVGLNGKPFKIYKFRTMVENAEKIGTGHYSFRNDKRVTPIGKILRKTSLDEIPQLLNVLRGDMSIVGPRPLPYSKIKDLKELPHHLKKRFSMKPGLTGWSQVNGRNKLSFEEKLKYDNDYIDKFERFGILFDLFIIIKTLLVIFNFSQVEEKPENYEKDKRFWEKIYKTYGKKDV